jgi:hypothetical protein
MPESRIPIVPGRRVLLGLVLAKLTIHLVTNLVTPFEFHRDEFLYFAMGDHLRLWHMDFPPLVAITSRVWRALLGDSLFAIRLVPALAGAAIVLLAGLLAREFGGDRRAQALAAFAVIANGLFLRAANLFQPVILDALWWTLGLYALVRLGRDDRTRWWVLLGVAGGLGLLTKFSILFFGLAILLALLVTPLRRALLGRGPWLALAIALVLGSPSIVGQVTLEFPVLEQMEQLRRMQLDRVRWTEFVLTQFLMFGPAALLALGGAGALLGSEAMRPYRVAGWTCLWTFVILLALHGKPYYLGPVYPVLFAAGAVAVGAMRRTRLASYTRRTIVVAMAAFLVALAPIGLPILTPGATRAWILRLGVRQALLNNRGQEERLPQDYGDMLGWKAMVEAVATVAEHLPPEQRAELVVYGENYGEAGALNFHGPRFGLPRPVSAAGSFWFFGPGERPGNVVITLGVDCADLRENFGVVTEARRFDDPWMVGEERDQPICVAERPLRSMQELWTHLGPRMGSAGTPGGLGGYGGRSNGPIPDSRPSILTAEERSCDS